MIKCILRGCLIIKNAPHDKINKIKKGLTFTNPKYRQAVKANRYIPPTMPKEIYLYGERGSTIIVPKGSCGFACNIIGVHESEVQDLTINNPIDINPTATPRDYQEEAIKVVMGRRYGILEALTGAGKTFCGVAIAAERKVSTLVIVHNKELLHQWVAEFKKFTDIEHVGLIGDGYYDIQDVTIGIINSVYNKRVELKSKFSFVIADECHRSMAPTWMTTLNTINSKFLLGLSATPFRGDGLTKALFKQIGPKVHAVDSQYLKDTGAVLVPRVERVRTHFFYKYNDDYSKLMTALTKDDGRNVTLGNTIIEDFRTHKEPMMVVSDRISHCDEIFEFINDMHGVKAVVLSSKVPKAKRTQLVRDLKSGIYNTLIATASLLSEGFDAPDLNALFLTTPVSFKGRLIQLGGRILRPSKNGGRPRVYDFRDPLIGVLRGGASKRDKAYEAQGWK